MKKKKCFLFALLIMCHPTLSFAQVDQQFTQQISSHLQDLKHFWGDLVNEIMPIIKKRMAQDFPEQYAKLTQTNADDHTILVEYNNLFVNKEYNSFIKECENKIIDKGKTTNRKPIKIPYNDGYSFELEGSNANCSDKNGCSFPPNYEPFKMRVSGDKIICKMADKSTNTYVYMKLRIEQNYNRLFVDQSISTTTYDNWSALKQKRSDPETDWEIGIKDEVGYEITRFRHDYRNRYE